MSKKDKYTKEIALIDERMKQPLELAKIISEAITGKLLDEELIREAVNRACNQHENQLRTYLVAFAKVLMEKSIDSMKYINELEDILFKHGALAEARVGELIKLYAMSWGNLSLQLDWMKKVTDSSDEIKRILSYEGSKEDDKKRLDKVFDKFPDANTREQARQALEMCLAKLEEDEKLIDVTPEE